MPDIRWHEIWQDQCEATESIPLRFGLGNAFGYVVGEKLLTFAEEEHSEFARALLQFVSELGHMFTPEEIEEPRVESAPLQQAMDAMDVADPKLDDLAALQAEERRFEFVKELLTAPVLRTS
ncbi:MAG: hypothetical protein OXF26_11180 [Alphaproteobacteria bacterium]|nr:hypothetical protein [Alphaproteobacteria bacterium]